MKTIRPSTTSNANIEPHAVEFTNDDGEAVVHVQFYFGETDGLPVVQIDAESDGDVRVNVNDGELATVYLGGNRIMLPEHFMEYERSGPDKDLALYVTPGAIRDHFEFSGKDPTQEVSDESLRQVGELVLGSQHFYDAFHDSLVDALAAIKKPGE